MQRVRKSRRGCAACKQKKVKCDETKPSCLRCTRLHRTCPGYNSDLKWSNKHEVLHSNESQKTIDELHASTGKIAHQSHGASKSVPKSTTVQSPEDETVLGGFPDADSDDFALFLEGFWSAGQLDGIAEPLSPPLPVLRLFDDDINNFTQSLSMADELDHMNLNQIETFQGQSRSGSMDRSKSPAGLPATSISRALIHHNSILVEYYFNSVASLYSCFDGVLNPFRTTISRFWSSSLVTKLTLQSMAAACIAREFPPFAAYGINMSQQAVREIEEEMRNGDLSDISLMCLIMLGQSAGWHNESDLGLLHFSHANNLLKTFNSGKRTNILPNTDSSFFGQAMSYWRMILSFISRLDKPANNRGFLTEDHGLVPQIVPHPWALIVPEMMNSISEVGKLVYSHRQRFRNKMFWKQSQVEELTCMISRCRKIESSLLQYRLPTEAEIFDTGDSYTPSAHLITVAEAYRLVSLIQLYRVFPDVLLERLNSTDHIELFENVPRSRLSGTGHLTDNDAQKWLRRLSLHTIEVLSSLPYESHTRSIQAFLYVAISSELQNMDSTNADLEALRVLQARNLVQSRLEGYRFIFAPKPAQRKLQLVLKIWEIMDTSGMPVFWLDVMLDNGLEVVFC